MMTQYPKDDLIRMAGSFELRDAGDGGDGNTMVGYPIVFNTPTEIDSWEGNFIERIMPGATKKTIAERGGQIQVLLNHGMDPQVGNKPLGKPTVMREDKNGLYTETPLANTSYNADIAVLLRAEILTGMSFRFSVAREEIIDDPGPSSDNPKGLPERNVQEIKLYEFGPVTFPAYEAASVGLRARWSELNSADLERLQKFLSPDAAFEHLRDISNDATPPSGHLAVHPNIARDINARRLKEFAA